MYVRKVKDRELNFAVSGMLWKRSLIMVDQETGSLWSHILGECMDGELKGQQIESLPALMTNWKTWREQYPKTTVLMMSRTSKNYQVEFYRDPSKFVLGMALGERARAWPFDQLIKQPVVNDRFIKEPVAIFFDQESSTALAFQRTLGDQELTFQQKDGLLIDEQTGSIWDRTSGEAVSGPMKGKHLQPVVGIISYRRSWRDFHPETELWQAE